MQSDTSSTFVRPEHLHHKMMHPENHYQPPAMQKSQLTLEKLERLAVARLQHTVNELQIQVDQDRTLLPPVRKIFHCVCDETALTAGIPELKRFVSDKSITMVVPLSALDALDRLKKGTEDENIHARESIRFFDRVQSPAGRKAINGVKIQGSSDRYANWNECLSAAASSVSPKSASLSSPTLADVPQDPPNRIKDLLNCAIYHLNKISGKRDDDVLLVTNDVIVREWAGVYGTPTCGTAELAQMIRREDIEFVERKRHYDYAQSNPRSPRTSVRGGRGGARGGRGGGGSMRRESLRDDRIEIDPNTFGRGRAGRDSSPPDYVLRSPPRGVARGRGKLWEP